MIRLNLPNYEFSIKEEGNSSMIFDVIRKKYLVLQPEEWVRQNFTQYLIQEKEVPLGLINNEITLKINSLNMRCDAVIYRPNGQALVIVEYKAPQVKITQRTFDQICRYNIRLKVPFFIVSNGLDHYCCQVNYINNQVVFLEAIPSYFRMLHTL